MRAQQESSDKNLKALHEQLVVKKPVVAKAQKAKQPQKKAKRDAPSTSKVQNDLKKMNVD